MQIHSVYCNLRIRKSQSGNIHGVERLRAAGHQRAEQAEGVVGFTLRASSSSRPAVEEHDDDAKSDVSGRANSVEASGQRARNVTADRH